MSALSRPVSVVRQSIRGLSELVFDPGSFIERQVTSRGIRVEIGIVVLVGVLNAAGLVVVGQNVNQLLEDSAQMNFVIAGQVMGPIIAAFMLWFLHSAAFHFIARFFRGRGGISLLLKGVAWALFPLGIAGLIRSIAIVFVYEGIDLLNALESADSTDPQEEFAALLQTGFEDPILIATSVLMLLAVAWSGYLMVFAVQHGKNVDRSSAMRIVAAPVAIQLVLGIVAIVRGMPNAALVM